MERQRLPHPLPRMATKIKSVRMINAPRKRRLSGRLARPPQLSNASEEGDMAQADEMGEGEGRDDGFVDGGEAVRKRNRKKPGERYVPCFSAVLRKSYGSQYNIIVIILNPHPPHPE